MTRRAPSGGVSIPPRLAQTPASGMRKVLPQSLQRDFFPASDGSTSYRFPHPGQSRTIIIAITQPQSRNPQGTEDPPPAQCLYNVILPSGD